jgi:hypothetical protein
MAGKMARDFSNAERFGSLGDKSMVEPVLSVYCEPALINICGPEQ